MYMSGPLLRYPRKPNHLFDDLISFIYVLEIMGLRFHMHSYSLKKLVQQGSTVKLIVDMKANKDNMDFAEYLHNKFLSQSTWTAGRRKILEFTAGKPDFEFNEKHGLAWLLTEFYTKLRPYFHAIGAKWDNKWGDELPVDSAQSAIRNSEDRKSTRLNSSHSGESRMPSSA